MRPGGPVNIKIKDQPIHVNFVTTNFRAYFVCQKGKSKGTIYGQYNWTWTNVPPEGSGFPPPKFPQIIPEGPVQPPHMIPFGTPAA